LNCFSDTPGQSFQTTTNKEGKVAESVFIAGLFVIATKEMEAIARYVGNENDRSHFYNARTKMENAIKSHGWDGKWFKRAYDNEGDPIGSSQCQEGKIFIEPQGICVMAGIGIDNGMAEDALNSVKERLAFKHGIVLLEPAYKNYYLNLGEISSYPPGYKENGSVFCHTNPWIMIAEAMIGRGDQAFDYYHRINPSAREGLSELHRCEPYVYSQMIAGKEALKPGEAKNSWLTGTASWNYVAITQYILGIRPTYEGLQISPVIPKNWKGFSATREYRGCEFKIDVERIGLGNSVSIEVNGEIIEGTIVPTPDNGAKKLDVHVFIQ